MSTSASLQFTHLPLMWESALCIRCCWHVELVWEELTSSLTALLHLSRPWQHHAIYGDRTARFWQHHAICWNRVAWPWQHHAICCNQTARPWQHQAIYGNRAARPWQHHAIYGDRTARFWQHQAICCYRAAWWSFLTLVKTTIYKAHLSNLEDFLPNTHKLNVHIWHQVLQRVYCNVSIGTCLLQRVVIVVMCADKH